MQQVQSYRGYRAATAQCCFNLRLLCRSGGVLGGRSVIGCTDDENRCKKDFGLWCALSGTDASETPTARPTAFCVDVVARTAEGHREVDLGSCDDQGSTHLNLWERTRAKNQEYRFEGQGQGVKKWQAGNKQVEVGVGHRSATLSKEEENDGEHCVYAESPMA